MNLRAEASLQVARRRAVALLFAAFALVWTLGGGGAGCKSEPNATDAPGGISGGNATGGANGTGGAAVSVTDASSPDTVANDGKDAAADLVLAVLVVNVAPGASTATIQAAIDHVSAAGGGVVNLTASDYTIATSLLMKSNVTLSGAGSSATTLTASGDFTVIMAATEGLTNVTIQDLKIVGTGAKTSTNSNGIVIASLSNYHSNVIIKNVEVHDCGGMGVHLKRVHGITVSDCKIHDNGGFGYMHNMYLRESTDMLVSNCVLTDSPAGTGLHIAGVCVNLTVTGCTVTGNGAQGINVQDTPDTVTIVGNTISNNGAGVGKEGLGFTGINSLIDSNSASNNGGYGMYLYGGFGSLSHNTALGNRLGNYNVHGQWLQSSNQ